MKRKWRIKFTCEDWYDYIGSNTWVSLRKRAIESMLQQIKYGKFYNFKFKRVVSFPYAHWHKFYRVSVSIEMTEEEILYMIKECESFMHHYSNFSYRQISRTPGNKGQHQLLIVH